MKITRHLSRAVNLRMKITRHLSGAVNLTRNRLSDWFLFKRELRPSDVFIVSHPKSGRHWVCFMLASIMKAQGFTGPSQLTLNSWKEMIIPLNRRAIKVDKRNLRRLRDFPDPRIFVCHAPYDPILPKVVYLVRDPRDVLVSFYYHNRRIHPNALKDISEFVTHHFAIKNNWHFQVSGWLEHAGDANLLIVRYEDLKHDTKIWLGEICRFCGLSVTQSELEEAVANGSLENMRAIERQYGKGTPNGDPSIPFVRKGVVGAWQEELSSHTAKLIEGKCHELMTKLNYKLHFTNDKQ